DDLFVEDFVLPAGRLRERRKNYRRAEIIVVTKCPKNLSVYDRKTVIEKIHPLAYQSVYFSTVKYQDLVPFFASKNLVFKNCLLLTGIANGKPLEAFLKTKFANVFSQHFSDHHHFSIADLEKIRAQFNQIGAEKTGVITTEKDAVRLLPFRDWFEQHKIPLYFQPISIEFLKDDEKRFRGDILQFLNNFAPEL
ncbi:MAG TPA: tetraacyldisaccharide 4'-kinase, partial [Chitinophagales bacterium]